MEDQNRILRRIIRWILLFWLITLILLGITLRPAFESFFGKEVLLPGQNYSTNSDSPES